MQGVPRRKLAGVVISASQHGVAEKTDINNAWSRSKGSQRPHVSFV